MKPSNKSGQELKLLNSYKPFSRPTAFMLVSGDKAKNRIWNSVLDYTIEWPNGSPAPRTGILLCQYLDSLKMGAPLVFDIGTGGNAILAIHCAKMGAKNVIGIDVDRNALKIARHNVSDNGLSKAIKIEEADVLTFTCVKKANLIVANLPHMPVSEATSPHDDGGQDGRSCITALFDLTKRCLKSDGVAIFTAPDYLGINRSYAASLSIKEIAASQGIAIRVERRFKMEIRPGSYTAANLDWIKKMYPKYKFGQASNGFITYWLCLVSAKHNHDN